MDVVIEGYVVNTHIVAEWAVKTTHIIYVSMVDSCTFMESEKAQHFMAIFVTRQVVGVSARFVHHDKSQPGD